MAMYALSCTTSPFLLVTDLRKYKSSHHQHSHRFCLRNAVDGKALSSIRVYHQCISPHLLTADGATTGNLMAADETTEMTDNDGISTYIAVLFLTIFHYAREMCPLSISSVFPMTVVAEQDYSYY